MKPFVRLLVVACLATTALVIPAEPSHASWVSVNCNTRQWADSHYRRKDALAYAAVARHEGYEWGGGCWNNDDRDDTPNAPDSNGEGPDCSGFTFKTWELQNNGGPGFTGHDMLQNDHGPYTAARYHAPVDGNPFRLLPNKNRGTTTYMDAFASTFHVGLIWAGNYPSPNTDYIGEALGDRWGTDVFIENYRFDSRYAGVYRIGWTPDCYPNCGRSEQIVVRIS